MKIQRILEVINPTSVNVGSKGSFMSADNKIICPNCRAEQGEDIEIDEDGIVECEECGYEFYVAKERR